MQAKLRPVRIAISSTPSTASPRVSTPHTQNHKLRISRNNEKQLPEKASTTMDDFRKRYVKFEPEEMTASLPPSPAPSSPRPTGRRYAMATELVFVDNPESGGTKDQYGASSMPIYQTATFKQTSATEMGEYDYTRSGNPTRSHLGILHRIFLT